MDETGDNKEQGKRTMSPRKTRNPDSSWAELLDSTGWGGRTPAPRPVRRLIEPEAEPALHSMQAPVVELPVPLPSSIDSGPEPEAVVVAVEAAVPTPEPALPAPELSEPELLEPELPIVTAGPVVAGGDAGTFNDWARLEGAGWGWTPQAAPPVVAESLPESAVVEPEPEPEPEPVVPEPKPEPVIAELEPEPEPEPEPVVSEPELEPPAAHVALQQAAESINNESINNESINNESINNELAERQREVEALTAQRETLISEVAAAEEQLSGARRALEALTGKRLTLERERTDLREAVEALNGELAVRQASLDALTAQRDALTGEIAAAQDQLDEARRGLEDSVHARETVDQERSVLEQGLAAFADEVAITKAEHATLLETATTLEARLDRLVTEVAAAEQRLACDLQAFDALAAERDGLQHGLASLADERDSLQEQQNRAREALAALEGERQRLVETIEATRTAAGVEAEGLAAIRREAAEVTQRRDEAAAGAREILHRRDLAAEEIEGLNRRVRALQAEVSGAVEERDRAVQDLQERRLEFQAVYQRDKKLLISIQREIAEGQRRLEELNVARKGKVK
ncbi:MAG: hypothetical protein WCF85_10340 [Rhodospirillaceae bacterium]